MRITATRPFFKNEKLHPRARIALLLSSSLFWILSIQTNYENPVYWTSRIVSVCSVLNYITYKDNVRGVIGQFDAIIVRVFGAHFLCQLSYELYASLSTSDASIEIIESKCTHFDSIKIYYKIVNLLLACSVGPIYYMRVHPNMQLLVHAVALAALKMYSMHVDSLT